MRRPAIGGPDIPWEHYFRLALRQRWLLITPALIGVLIMGLYSLTLKDQYQAKATILVEPQSIPTEFMRSTLPYGPEKYVRSLVDQIKSITRLEKVILQFNLYPEMRAGKTLEEVVALMRDKIEIERRENDTFSVAFIGDDPQVVQQVTNRLTDMFIEENTLFRLERSAQNVAFLEGEARKLREQVSAQEQRIQEYKTSHLDSLPEQQQSIQVQLNAARQRLESNSQALASTRSRALSARERIALLSTSYDYSAPDAPPNPRETELERARQQLVQLRAQYSDQHPDVQTKVKEIAALEAHVARSGARPVKHRRRAVSPELLRATDEIRLAEGEVARLEGEQAQLQKEIVRLTERLEQSPRVELDLSDLTKGLSVIQEQADSYQKKASDAAASLELERRNQGSQFRALDRARVPAKPVSPNRPMLVMLGGIAGLVLGLFLVIGLDVLFRPFLEEQDLAEYAQIPVLVSIPQLGPMPSEAERLRAQLVQLFYMLIESLPFATERYAQSRKMAPPIRIPSLRTWTDPADEQPAPAMAAELPSKGFTYLIGEPVAANRGARPVGGFGGGASLIDPDELERVSRKVRKRRPGGDRHEAEGNRHQPAPTGNGRNGERPTHSSGRITSESIRPLIPSLEPGLEAGEKGGAGFHVRLGDGEDRVKVETGTLEDGSRLKAAFTGARPKTREELAQMLARAAEEGARRRTGTVRTTGSGRTPPLIAGTWGNPSRYRISSRLGLNNPEDADETLKELYRRPPWHPPR